MKILNRKASFEYQFIQEYIAGIQLFGSEVKSLRNGNASIGEAFCYIWDGEIFLKNSFISKYTGSTYNNHQEKRDRKLLLHKKEIRDISKMTRENGITIVPIELFIKDGRYKIKIAVSKGKKLHDKRESIKSKDAQREIERSYK
jgi:SsrA-binding protein